MNKTQAQGYDPVLKNLRSPDTVQGVPIELSNAPAYDAARSVSGQLAEKPVEQPKEDLLGKHVDLPSGPENSARRQSVLLAKGAKAKMGVGDHEAALEAAQKAIDLDPTNPEAWVRKAEALSHLKRYAEAEEAASKATELDPDYGNAWQALAWAQLKQKKFDAAEASASKAIDKNPDDPHSWAIRAYARDSLGRRDEALTDLAEAAKRDSKYSAKLAAAQNGEKIYDPDQESMLGDAIASVTGGRSAWPLIAGGAGLLLLGGIGAGVLVARRKRVPQDAAKPAPSNGRVGGKYELIKIIGRGGMGAVYEALDHSLQRPVAVKRVSEELLSAEPTAREMLVKEARTVAALHHPAIVEIYEICEEPQDVYVVFELVKGRTLGQILAEKGRLSLKECAEILKPVCEALQFAHERGLVHRDLKPANVMIDESGRVKLMDFGVARSLADGSVVAAATAAPAPSSADRSASWQARTRTVVGTPAYMPPEAENGVVSAAWDVYGLGVMLYELTTGARPYGAEASALEKIGGKFRAPSSYDLSLAPIDALVAHSLEGDAARRPGGAAAFMAALAKAAS